MKKLLLLFALGVSMSANAQLTVFENGQVRVGDYSQQGTSDADMDISSCLQQTTPSSITKAMGSISFGGGKNALISGYHYLGTVSLYGSNSVSLGVGNKSEALKLNAVLQSITSGYNISAPAFLTSSDVRLKTNVESLNESCSKLQNVNAVSYYLTYPSSTETMAMNTTEETLAKNTSEGREYLDDRLHFGFIAQEIQKIYPNLVVEGENGLLSVDYTGFIPLLVEAYKELSNKIREQEEVIDALMRQNGPTYMPSSVNIATVSKPTLKQNKPNPFNTVTIIECSIPQSVASAFICIYDLQGKQIYRIDISERGEIESTIDASYFAPGMYIYALIADGVEIDSKRMIITD